MLTTLLTSVEVRIVASLIEKEATTPEYYPLTFNALQAACNQKTNRWPVSSYAEEDISEGLQGLKSHRYAAEITGAGMRVPKYAQRFTETLNLGRRETAVLCVLMLRGPQTLSELRDRTERMHNFADSEEVEGVIHRLSESGMAVQVAKMQGQKERRYAHLFAGPVEQEAPSPETSSGSGTADRLNALEAELVRLRGEVEELRRKLESIF